jgi:beta-glucosidase-like glycosyl hydrolase
VSDIAQLLLPAIRWDSARGYEGQRATIERALQLGVGGFILFGGGQDEVRALTKELRQRSRVPLLIAADLERGAGQQFTGATGLPPLAAIASLNDPEAVRRAARLTAREARTMGVNWDYAPVCDLDVRPDNPIVGTRSLGADPERVAMLAVEWIRSCQSEGVLACAKHFPGHGRTTTDSHMELPRVDATKKLLLDTDLVPFRAAVSAGVASIMTAHVAYPALDASQAPATLSREILQWLLREQLKFDGLVVTDALTMEGCLDGQTEAEAAIRALDAGCDLLLYPADMERTARALEAATRDGTLDRARVQQSLRRRLKWSQWASPPNEYRRPAASDVAWGAQLADRVVHVVRGNPRPLSKQVEVILIDDDVGGPYPPPSREPFFLTFASAGIPVRRAETPTMGGGTVIIALFGDVRGWKGRAGYSAETRAAVERACGAAPGALVVQFSHPRLAREITFASNVLNAWGGEPPMQQAAARWLLRRRS